MFLLNTKVGSKIMTKSVDRRNTKEMTKPLKYGTKISTKASKYFTKISPSVADFF